MMARRFAAALALSVTLAATPVDASLIVYLGTSQRIVVAADSRVSGPAEALAPLYPRAGCKLALSGRFILGAGGLRYLFPVARGVPEVWNSLGTPAGTLRAQWRRLADALLGEPLANSREVNDAQVAVAGFEDGLPTIIGGNFDAPAGVPRLAVSNEGWAQNRTSVVLTMVTDLGIDRAPLHRELREAPTTEAVAAIARRVIRAQAQRFPDLVGGDVDLAIVEPHGVARWVTVKPACR